jgi:hypothetical protein
MKKYSKISLLWETFHFYSSEISKQEEKHLKEIELLASSMSKTKNLQSETIKKQKRECLKTVDSLINLYRKQILCIHDLLDFHQSEEIPLEFEVDSKSLNFLENVTESLISEMMLTRENLLFD